MRPCKKRGLDKLRFPNTPVGSFGQWGGAAALLVLATKEGAWSGADESRAAPTVAPFIVASSTVFLSVASLSATASFMASSTAPITVTSSMALLSTAAITAAASDAVGASPLPLGPTALERRHSHFCRGSSSLDDTSSSSRKTRACLCLSGGGAWVEPPMELPHWPPAEMPPRSHAGPPLAGMLPWPPARPTPWP
jgi:hypothetical protein